MHKSPIVATTCNFTLNDIVHLDTIISYYAGNVLTLNPIVHVAENFLFNIGDVFYMLELGRQALIDNNYVKFG